MTFSLAAYLERIGLKSIPKADLATLSAVQRAQIDTIAFENIDVLLGRLPALEPEAVWTKLVTSYRGGWCLELNALFGLALSEIGFDARPVLGRVRMGAPEGGPRAHHAFIVTIDGEAFLADTGFGGPGPRMPVRLGTVEPQVLAGETYRMRPDARSGETVLEKQTGDAWFSLYGFDLMPVAPIDCVAANVVCARWDLSPFPSHLMMTIGTETGRLNLFDTHGKWVRGNKEEEFEITSEAMLAEILATEFGIAVPPQTVSAIWQRIALPAEARRLSA